jgi:hypothetical protein
VVGLEPVVGAEPVKEVEYRESGLDPVEAVIGLWAPVGR